MPLLLICHNKKNQIHFISQTIHNLNGHGQIHSTSQQRKRYDTANKSRKIKKFEKSITIKIVNGYKIYLYLLIQVIFIKVELILVQPIGPTKMDDNQGMQGLKGLHL